MCHRGQGNLRANPGEVAHCRRVHKGRGKEEKRAEQRAEKEEANPQTTMAPEELLAGSSSVLGGVCVVEVRMWEEGR